MLSEHYKNRLEETAGLPAGILIRTEREKLKQRFRSHKTESIYIVSGT